MNLLVERDSMEFGERANQDLLFYIEDGKFFRVFGAMQFDGDEMVDSKYRKVNARQVDVEELDDSIQTLVLGVRESLRLFVEIVK